MPRHCLLLSRGSNSAVVKALHLNAPLCPTASPQMPALDAIPRLVLGSLSEGITSSLTGAKTQLKWDIREADFLYTELIESCGNAS